MKRYLFLLRSTLRVTSTTLAPAMFLILLIGSAQNQEPPLPPGAPPPTPEALKPHPNVYKHDSIVFQLNGQEWIEYKYRMEKGATMVYSWKAPVKIRVEMHSEPEGGPRGYAEFFEKDDKEQGHGTYTAPFSGIHGWYWKNSTDAPITIALKSAGFYSSAEEFRDRGRRTAYPLADSQ